MSENQIITTEANSLEYTEAMSLHRQIIANGTIAANALYEMCRCLKQMRDEKLYTALGYEDFDTYCEEKANIRSRQAYNYIKTYESLGKEFLQSNANIGITKLELLTHVNPLDRQEFVEQTDIESISVEKLKEEIDRLKRENGEKGYQLSMLEDEKNTLESELEELRNAPKEVAVSEPDPEEINARISEAVAKSEKEHKKEVRELKAKLKEYESSKGNYENQLNSLNEKLNSEHKAADERIKSLEEQIKNVGAADAALIEFKFYFNEMQETLKKFVGVLNRVDDAEKRAKFKAAAQKYIGMISEELNNE